MENKNCYIVNNGEFTFLVFGNTNDELRRNYQEQLDFYDLSFIEAPIDEAIFSFIDLDLVISLGKTITEL